MWVSLILEIVQRYWKFVVIAALAVALWFVWNRLQTVKHERNVYENTNSELLRKDSERTKQVVLDKETFKAELKTRYAWVLDSIKKNPRVVTKVQYIKTYRNIHDTVPIYIDEQMDESDTIITKKAVLSDCGVTVTATWDLGGSSAAFELTDTSETAIVVYKSNPWFKFWNKTYDIQVVNKNCGKIIANEQISRIKRKKK